MKLQLKEGLPYTTISLTYRGQQITFDNILVGCDPISDQAKILPLK